MCCVIVAVLMHAGCFSEGDTAGDGAGTDATSGATSTTNAATSTADTSSTNSGSMSAGQSGTSGDGSSSADSDGTTGPAPEDPYSACFPFAFGGCDVTQQCAEGCLVNYDNDTQVCTWGCGVAAPCPEPLSGNAPAVCASQPHTCVLDCSAGQTCPDGMVCDSVSFAPGQAEIMACAWPTTDWRPPYSACFETDNACSLCALTQNAGGSCASDTVPDCPEPHNCANVCLPLCGGDFGECPPSPDPMMPAVCLDLGSGMGECVIDCEGDGLCPAGMQCEEWNYGGVMAHACMWPPP